MEWSPELQCLLMLLVRGNPEDVESVGQPTGCSSICPHTSDVLLLPLLLLLNQACAPAAGWHVPGFLKLIMCGSSICVFMCVCVHARGY